MPPQRSTSNATASPIGRLCVGGDWACAHGDFGGLRHIAFQLQSFVPEPIHCQLSELASACLCDPQRAGAIWDGLKSVVYREGRS